MKNRNEEEIYQYFAEEDIPQFDEATKQKFRELVKKNKPNPKLLFWKRFSVLASCAICLMLFIILPFTLNRNSTPTDGIPPKYYMDDEVVKRTLTEQEVAQFIDDGFSKYQFLLTDCDFNSALGLYAPDTDNLLALSLDVTEKDIPFTFIKVNIVISDQLQFNAHNSYVDEAEKIESDNCIIYKKIEISGLKKYLMGHLQYQDYKLYFILNKVNNELFNKFI